MFQFDDFDLRIEFFQIQKVADLSPAPAVNALIVITDHAKIPMLSGQQIDQLELGRVRILILVHHDILIPATAGFQRIGMFIEQFQHQQDDVIEIHRVGGLQGGFIQALDMLSKDDKGLRLIQKSVVPVVLVLAHQGVDRLGFQLFTVHVDVAHDLAHGSQLIRLVIDDKVVLVAQTINVPAQDAHAERMESTDSRTLDFAVLIFAGVLGNKSGHTFLHFTGSLVGKGHRQDLPRRDTVLDKIGYTIGNDTRLARTGSGQDHDGTLDSGNRFPLLRI